jgi:hypothetical protein
MSKWKSFGVASYDSQEGYEKSLEGGQFFGLGTHEVVISAIEPKESAKGTAYLKVTFEGDGKSIFHNIFLTATDKKSGELKLNLGYSKVFAGAIVNKNMPLQYKFFNCFAPENPEVLEALVGSKLRIKIEQQKEGYSIEHVNDGYIIMDVATKEPVVLADKVENLFDSFDEAKTVATNQGLERAWNEVTSMLNSELENDNNGLIQRLLDGKVAKKKKVVSM